MLVGGRARLSETPIRPPSARGFIVVNILAELYAALVMSAVALLVPQREIAGNPPCSGLWPTVRFWRRRWVELMVVCIEKLACQYCQLKQLAVPVCGVLFSWWLLGENPGPLKVAVLC